MSKKAPNALLRTLSLYLYLYRIIERCQNETGQDLIEFALVMAVIAFVPAALSAYGR